MNNYYYYFDNCQILVVYGDVTQKLLIITERLATLEIQAGKKPYQTLTDPVRIKIPHIFISYALSSFTNHYNQEIVYSYAIFIF